MKNLIRIKPKTLRLWLFCLASLPMYLSVSTLQAQNAKAQTPQANRIEVIQFHNAHRCRTCLEIERLTKQTVESDFSDAHTKGTLVFRLVNVEEAKNKAMVNKFEAAGSALYLYNPRTQKIVELTDMAFMRVGTPEKFKAELKAAIQKMGS